MVAALGGAVAVLALIALFGVLTGGEEPRARQYLDSKACLLTGADGVTEPETSAVWTALQDASVETRVKVQYLAATGPATVANARPFLGTLIALDCDLIVAVGDVPGRVVGEVAPSHLDRRFVVVGVAASQPNVASVAVGSLREVIAGLADGD
ncbi:hypothetical protein [Actinocorallia sp. A-T 12471]|uniref:hypothetical protein n=1 Tax=Actinocorallia sp. A-T 12471 TaxID=3089813 RepID=UPI0029CDB0DD|nr:hypothetical protein [Actinocorallia sp. A-T 12471]MDX6740736.1 hypothetical protein [Actinocorallia sp. A-T 12471]